MAKKAVTISAEQEAKALTGYKAAISLWSSAGASARGSFNVMLVANAILLAMLTIILSEASGSSVAPLVLAVVGIVLSGAWFILIRRGFEQQDYYLKSAREIEEIYLSDTLQTLARGADFALGEEVEITEDGKIEKSQLSALAGVFSAELGALIVAGLFGAAYILLAFLTALAMMRRIF